MKGLGIASLKGLGIMDALKAGVENKGEAAAREGAPRACLGFSLGSAAPAWALRHGIMTV